MLRAVVKAVLLIALVALLALAAPAAAQTTVWAVGDAQGENATAQLGVASRIQSMGPFSRLLMIGDLTEDGTFAEYTRYYDPSYGRFKSITSPVPGNHDWPRRAEGYDRYWGGAHRQPGGGHYYSFDLAGWHFIALNSEEPIGARDAPQLDWLRSDLSRYKGTCTIAYVHKPRFSAGPQFNTYALEPVWATLQGDAVAMLGGHAHSYQRHYPTRGITQFVVGTGGGVLRAADTKDARLAAVANGVNGALRLKLGLGEADYEFVSVTGEVLDSGKLECVTHGPAPARIATTRPRSKRTYRAFRTFTGRLRNTRRVRLSLIQRIGRSCRAFDGAAFRRSSCSSRKSFPIPLASPTRFKWKAPEGLEDAGYRLTVGVRAIDGTTKRRVTRFKVGERPRKRRRI